MIYIMSDIHGKYSSFIEMLNLIQFNRNDMLYILGDIIDKGDESIKLIEHCYRTDNIKLLLGNHEQMMLNNLVYNNDNYNEWYTNGGYSTYYQFQKLHETRKLECLKYLENLPLTDLITVNNVTYFLSHAGLYPYNCDTIEELLKMQSKDDVLWIRKDFFWSSVKLPFKVIFGHTYTEKIKHELDVMKIQTEKKYEKGKIIYFNNKIGIDCGANRDINLACLRLNDMKEFYIKIENEID